MLSVCIITKNEEKNITQCLTPLKQTGIEIIIVDTGSTDHTKNLAQQYTNKIYEFPWCDDFAAAKNFAISKAATPYVMVIDSDEILEPLDVQQLLEQLQKHPHQVGRICRKNVFTRKGIRQENKEWLNRIFAKDEFGYEGRIHEQVMAKNGEDYQTYKTPVTILHTGYDLSLEERKEKAARNTTLLLQELMRLEQLCESGQNEQAEGASSGIQPQKQLPYILYQLGKSCYMEEHYSEACEYFARGLSYDLDSKLEYVIDMVETYGYALVNSGQPGEALFFENIYEDFGDSADFQFLMGIIYMNNSMFEEAVAEFQKATKHPDCRSTGVNSYAAYYNIGVIYECLDQKELAKKYYKKCGNYEPAEKRLNS